MNRSPHSPLRRGATGAAAALVAAGALATAGPALAVPITDGTSNTVQLTVTSATLDQARHRVLAISSARPDLSPGTHLATLQLNAPQMTLILSNVMVESIAGTDSPAPGSMRINVKYTMWMPD